jgi:hypothetical protein
VKKLLPLTKTAANEVEERRSLFSDFRREVWLMSGLDHPNLVVLKVREKKILEFEIVFDVFLFGN